MTTSNQICTTKYQDSLFYQINSCAKCFDILFENFFKELDLGISATEHLALCIIDNTKDCCQRDLAKIIFKDRANTGKLASKLESKGLIEIKVKTKNNKPVKILTVTEKGQQLRKEVIQKIMPMAEQIKNEVGELSIQNMISELENFRQVVKNVVKTNI